MALTPRLLAGMAALLVIAGCTGSTEPIDVSGVFRLERIEGVAIPHPITATEALEGEVLSLAPDGRAWVVLEILHVAGGRAGEREERVESGSWAREDGLIALTTPERRMLLRTVLGGAWLRTIQRCGVGPCVDVLIPERTYRREATRGMWVAGSRD